MVSFELVPLLIMLERAELTSEDIVFLMVGMLILSVVGMKLVPLFKSSMRSGGRLISVKLCILLLDSSFSFSASSCDFCVRLLSVSHSKFNFNRIDEDNNDVK